MLAEPWPPPQTRQALLTQTACIKRKKHLSVPATLVGKNSKHDSKLAFADTTNLLLLKEHQVSMYIYELV